MAQFHFHLRGDAETELDKDGLEFANLEQAYLAARKSIPDVARDMLISGRDPMRFAYVICDNVGRSLIEVPFTEVLSPAEWRTRRARRRPHGGFRSSSARDALALSSFRRMFGAADLACVLLTPELVVKEITDFGARHSHVDRDAVRDTSILDIFVDLQGESKDHFTRFMMLARAGAVSEVVDLPYYVLDEAGETACGWWKARTWPIFDDDDHLLGLVELAEPHLKPLGNSGTLVRVAPTATP